MKRRFSYPIYILLLGFFLLSGCNWDPIGISEPWQPEASEEPCNGNSTLCNLRYDEVTYPTTHNSYNYETGVTQFFQPNQEFPVGRQLRDGVRAFMLDIWDYQGDIIVLHRNQDIIDLVGEDAFVDFLGSEPLSDPLGDIKDFLDANPREIVTLILETDLTGSTLETEFTQAGLIDDLYIHSGGDWPTLIEMIENGTRLVVFTENSAPSNGYDWLHPVWNHTFDTSFSVEDSEDFDCLVNRGNASNNLFLMNHWIVPLLGGGDQTAAQEVNEFDFLFNRTIDCWTSHGHKPNFVAVDFYNTGDLIAVCDSLNQLTTP